MVQVKGAAKVVGLAVAFVLLGGAKGCSARKKPTANGPAVEVTPKELWQAYKDNEVSADEKYRNRTLRMTGTVTRIAKDITDDAYVTIAVPGAAFESVRARFEAEGQLRNLKRGQQITIRCVGDNVVLGSPRLVNCVLEDSE